MQLSNVFSSMQISFLCFCFLIKVSSWQVLTAPGCDLKTIFRTPRRNFDELELIERSNFDHRPEKCKCRRRNHLEEDFEDYNKPYANAQILLRIGSDKEDNHKVSEEPCIPVSKLVGDDKVIVSKDPVPYYNPVQYQQNLCPCPIHSPYVFPNCLYYDPVGTICSHILPVMREILLKKYQEKEVTDIKSDNVEDSIDIDNCDHSNDQQKNSDVNSSVVSNCDHSNDIKKNSENYTDEQNQKVESDAKEQEIQPPLETKPEILEPIELIDELGEKPSKKGHKKASDKDYGKRKSDKDTNIQKITQASPEEIIDYSTIIEADRNGKFISLNAIKLDEPTANDDIDVVTPIVSSRNCNVTLHLLKIEPNKLNNTSNESNTASDIMKLLNEALIPIVCSGCDNQTKNVVSYPIVNRKTEEDYFKNDLTVENCGCQNCLDQDIFKKGSSRFSADLDDLNLMNGEPIPQSSIIDNFAPKFYKNLMVAKSMSKYLPLLRDPRVSVVKYNGNYEVPERTPEEPNRCTCKNCQCHLKRALMLEKPTIWVQPEYREEVSVLPSYLSRRFERPLPIYEHAIEQSSDEILMPVAIIHEDEPSGRCTCCAPYMGELNE